MKIGLYGGLANNCYVFAKALNSSGLDIEFIRDRSDSYVFSQPVWEDTKFFMNYEAVEQSTSLTWSDWKSIENKNNWRPPSWLVDPVDSTTKKIKLKIKSLPLSIIANRYISQVPHRQSVIARMRKCNVLIVCGIEASILAMLSERPFLIWPHGGDIRVAAGIGQKPKNLRLKLSYELQRHLLLAAYEHAGLIGTHDAKGLAGSYGNIDKVLNGRKLAHIPIPSELHLRKNKESRRKSLKELFHQLGLNLPNTEYIGVVASRVDFNWKGHDLLLNALSELMHQKNKDNMHLIFSGWGRDYYLAKKFVIENKIEGMVTFLPFALSKPLLQQLFSAADFTVDQFRSMGTYGTAMVEALSAGAPTLMWIDTEAFIKRGWQPPPVINAHSTEDITNKLFQIANGEICLEALSKESQHWISLVHSYNAVIPNLVKQLAQMN